MLIRKPAAAAFAAAALAAVLAAGCGSSNNDNNSSSSSSSTPSAPATSGPKLSGAPLKVGIMCACTGPVSGTYGGVPKLVTAWEKWTNAHGGINGHPVKTILVDTKNDPAASVKEAQKLVSEKVQAIVAADFQEASWKKVTNKAGIPVTGGNSADAVFLTDPMLFPSTSTVPILYFGMGNELKKLGKAKVGVMACAELPVCAGVPKLFAGLSTVADPNIKVVYQGKISATAPNYTAQCVAAKQSKADVGFIAHSSDVIVRVADQCAQQGWKPQQVNYGPTISANWLKDPNLDGAISAQGNVPLGTNDTPGMKAFNSAVDQYGDGLKDSSQYGEVSLNQWSGLELFKKAAENAKSTASSTGADTLKGLYAMRSETLDGIAPPLTFKKGSPANALVPCYFAQGIKGGNYTAPNGSKPICASAKQMAALGGILAKAFG